MGDIEEFAYNILQYCDIVLDASLPSSPISFRKILRHFPTVKYLSVAMSHSTDGLYVPTNTYYYLVINSNKPYVRRRFTLGHEFGHYCLGHVGDLSIENEDQWILSLVSQPFRSLRPDRRDVEANRFAAALLMPVPLMLDLRYRFSTLEEISRWLRVSDIATAIRCKQLGILLDEAEFIIENYWLSHAASLEIQR